MALSKKLTDEDKEMIFLEKKIQEKIDMIKRQTDYDEETIINKLKEHEYNTETIIKEFMGIPLKKKEIIYSSNNIGRYSEIRKFMDNTYREYRKRIELKNEQDKNLNNDENVIPKNDENVIPKNDENVILKNNNNIVDSSSNL